MKKIIVLLSICTGMLVSCQEEYIGQYPTDGQAPGQVTNVTTKSVFGGGVILSYTIPDDPDLQGVKAVYTLDTGKEVSTMVSAYSREIMLEGFASPTEHTARLYSVDKSQNESEPVTVTFTPLRSPIFDVFESLKISSDFGGAKLTWENPEMKDVIVNVSKAITEGSDVQEDVQNFYSSAPAGEGFIRGFDAVPVTFNVSISDKYGNKTETISQEVLPLYEEQIDGKTYWTKWNGDPDIPYRQYSKSYPITKLWDGKTMAASTSSNFFHTPAGYPFPVRFTFDMRQVYKLSRMKVYQRGGTWVYTHGNPKRFQVYGSLSPHASISAESPEDQWIFLGEFESFKPSGLPLGQYTPEDSDRGAGGEDFTFPIELATEVRYIRFDVLETWGGTEMIHISELEMWGQPEGYNAGSENNSENN